MNDDFSDLAMTLAAIDRLVHHATILEMNVESYRRKAALKRKRGPRRLNCNTAQTHHNGDFAGVRGDYRRDPS
jgi:hypothetical protein